MVGGGHAPRVADHLRASRGPLGQGIGHLAGIQARFFGDQHAFRGTGNLHRAHQVDHQFVGGSGADGAEMDDLTRKRLKQWPGRFHIPGLGADQQRQIPGRGLHRNAGDRTIDIAETFLPSRCGQFENPVMGQGRTFDGHGVFRRLGGQRAGVA